MPTAPDVNALVVQWLPLATGLARKFGARYPWLSDCFESLAGETLWKLAGTHGHMVELPAYVRHGVRWAIIRRVQQEYVRNRVAFGQQLGAADADGDELPDVFDTVADDEPDVGAGLEAAEQVAALLGRAKLTPYQRALVEGRYFEGAEFAELAEELGASERGARCSLGLAVGKLRAAAG